MQNICANTLCSCFVFFFFSSFFCNYQKASRSCTNKSKSKYNNNIEKRTSRPIDETTTTCKNENSGPTSPTEASIAPIYYNGDANDSKSGTFFFSFLELICFSLFFFWFFPRSSFQLKDLIN